ncbi:hypothetical protein [Enterococcus hirae]|uniref:hypothetical protein n=1 Tax=Enterococcus hirae TaxID=1354 RepID=UPI00136D7164|nr:hypothetical protein [Enterococcus hirae]NAE18304.1 hypothetical protein [Enterococcus hirae]
MSSSDEMSASERNELRRVIRARFKVLRAEVTRREQELNAEVELGLAERYAAQDAAISAARADLARAQTEAQTELDELERRAAEIRGNLTSSIEAIAELLRTRHPELDVEVSYRSLKVSDRNRAQVRRAATTSIPSRVADALLDLDRQEASLLERIAVGALESDAARDFLGSIPTVAALVPSARMYELAGLDAPQAGAR